MKYISYLKTFSFFALAMLLAAAGHAATTTNMVEVNANDVVYNPFSHRLYASVSSTDVRHGNSLVVIHPETGEIESSTFVGSEPKKVAISSDGQYVYTGLDGSGRVSRYHVPSGTVDLEFSLGGGSFGTTYVEDLAVQPGNPDVLAVSRYRKGVSPRHDGVAIYDRGVKRTRQTNDHTGANVIEFSDTPNVLFGYNNETTEYGLRTINVSEFGAETLSTDRGLISGFYNDIEYDDERIYATNGQIVNTVTMQQVGLFATSGKVEPDHEIRRTFFIDNSTIRAFNQETFVLTGEVSIPGISGSPRNLIRWGTQGLAFATTGGQVVIVETDLVVPAPNLTSLVIEGPSHVSSYNASYKITSSFDDGVVTDVTRQALWSTDPSLHTAIDSSGTLAVFGTSEPGAATITAKFAWAGVTHTATMDITYDGTIPATGNLVRLEIQGEDKVQGNGSSEYAVIAYFDDQMQYDVTDKVLWSIEGYEFASLDEQGVLSCGDVARYRDAVFYASFGHKFIELDAVKTVLCVPQGQSLDINAWPMFQANPQHTGYLPIALEPEDFSMRWERQLGTRRLNPVTAAAGKVFVSEQVYFNAETAFHVLDTRDGETLWSKNFGSVFSVNPPSYGYGNVYIQTGNHGSDTYLHAFNADNGDNVFQSSHAAQWERYESPTIYDGSVYVNGGYYGGMYGFDAFSGEQEWFKGLRQDAGWTPAVNGRFAYSFVEGDFNAIDRLSGTTAFTLQVPGASYRTSRAVVLGDRDNALIVVQNRLISINLGDEAIDWDIGSGFAGLPALAKGVIYVINSGSLEARDEANGTLLWSWNPPESSLTDTMIVTDTHVLTRTDSNTYAVDLLSQEAVWSYPASGPLSLGNETLYIAQANGVLTAIATPEYIPATPVSVKIEGVSMVPENGSATYTATVYYDDGRMRDRTATADWSVAPGRYARIDAEGALSVGELLYPEELITINVQYQENGKTLVDSEGVVLFVEGTISDLVRRNITDAISLKLEILEKLEVALRKERAAKEVLKQLSIPASRASNANKQRNKSRKKARKSTGTAIKLEEVSKKLILQSIDHLDESLEGLDQ